MNNPDISTFMTWFINIFLEIWEGFWNILKSFKFNGTNLYYIVIIIIVLRVGVPILVQMHEEGKQNEMKIERQKHGRDKSRN